MSNGPPLSSSRFSSCSTANVAIRRGDLVRANTVWPLEKRLTTELSSLPRRTCGCRISRLSRRRRAGHSRGRNRPWNFHLVEVFVRAIITVEIKICLDGKQIGGEVFSQPCAHARPARIVPVNSASRKYESGVPVDGSARIDRARLDETKRVVPPILGVERALAPGLHADLTAGRSHARLPATGSRSAFRSLEDRVEVVHDEVKCLGRGVRRVTDETSTT